jgi:hypothetical protein
MPQDSPRPPSSPDTAIEAGPSQRVERWVLHGWILAIALALIWVLLS